MGKYINFYLVPVMVESCHFVGKSWRKVFLFVGLFLGFVCLAAIVSEA